MTVSTSLIGRTRDALPQAALARWASVFFSLSVLTYVFSLAASQALLAVAGVIYVFHLLHDHPPILFLPIKLPLALFCLFSILSVFWAANPTVGWFAVRKLVLFLIWLLAVNLIVSASHLRTLYKGLFIESAVTGLVATGQFIYEYRRVHALHPHRIYFYMTAERIHGFMGHWMNFGGQQMLIFVALIAFLLLSVRPRRLWWVVFAIAGLSIVLNFTRGVWLACFIALIYLGARWKRRWLWALPILLLLGFVAAPRIVRRRIKINFHPTSDPSLAIRFEMWKVGLRMIKRHPLLGVGPDNIIQVYDLYLAPGEQPERGYHGHLHDNFIQFGAERGLPCLAAWVWLMAALGWNFVRIRRRLGKDNSARWIIDGTLAAWLALLVEGCFEFNFGTSPVLMVFLFISSTPFIVENIEVLGLKTRKRVSS